MKKRPSNEILQDPARHVKLGKNLLAKLWRRILADIGMNIGRWSNLMEKHLDDPREKIPNTSTARSSERGNLNRALLDEEITWNVFEKGIRFVGPVRAEFVVRLHWPNKTITEHAITMLNNRINDTGEPDSIQEPPGPP